jgi:tetratricopeptide (TPR) repeat protein
VADFAWIDDFAAARNHALDLARGDWILYIDADERARGDRAILDRALRDPRCAAHWVLLHVHPSHTPYHELRVFRNDPRIRFEGIIHETVWPSVRRLLQDGMRMGDSGLALDHLGYIGDQAHKVARNLPLLQRAVAREPARVYLWCELAKAYDGLGRDGEADAALQQALALARANGHADSNDSIPYIESIRSRLRRGQPADDLVAEALTAVPENRQLLWFAVCRLMEVGEFGQALEVLPRVYEARPSPGVDMTASYDRRILGEFAFEAAAICHFKLGRYADAARWFARAAAEQPSRADLQGQLQMARRLAGSE